MSAVVKFVQKYTIVPYGDYIERALVYMEDVIKSAVEEVMSRFGIEDEVILKGFLVVKQLNAVETRHKEQLIRTINDLIGQKCNQDKNLLDKANIGNSIANAKLNRPYYLALAQTWEGFATKSNFTTLKVLEQGVIEEAENVMGITVTEVVSLQKGSPTYMEHYAFQAFMISDPAVQKFIGDMKIEEPSGRILTIVSVTYNVNTNMLNAVGSTTKHTSDKTITTTVTEITGGYDLAPIAGRTLLSGYSLDGVATDYTAHAYHGIEKVGNSTTPITTWVDTTCGKGFNCPPGTSPSPWIQLPAEMGVHDSYDRTIAVYASTTTGTSAWGRVFDFKYFSDVMLTVNASMHWTVIIRDNSTGTNYTLDSGVAAVADQVYHITCVLKTDTEGDAARTGVATIYIDGVNKGTVSYVHKALTTSPRYNVIGESALTPGDGANNFEGMIDHLVTFRGAFTATEVTSLYNGAACTPAAQDTKLTVTIREETRYWYDGETPPAYWYVSQNTTVTERPYEVGDVEGTVVDTTYNDYDTIEGAVSLQSLPALAPVEFVVMHFLSGSPEYVFVTDFDTLPEGSSERISIDKLEMMPLIRIRENNTNVNGIPDSTYIAITHDMNDGTCNSSDVSCALPESDVPENPSPVPDSDPGYNEYLQKLRHYNRYVSTNSVLRSLGMTIDVAVGMVCSGNLEIAKTTAAYVRFGINPLARRVKPGLGKNIKLEDATREETELIPSVLHATYGIFELMADNGAFSPIIDFPAQGGARYDSALQEYYFWAEFDPNTPVGYRYSVVHWVTDYPYVDKVALTATDIANGIRYYDAPGTDYSTYNNMRVKVFDASGDSLVQPTGTVPYYTFQSAVYAPNDEIQADGTYNFTITFQSLTDEFLISTTDKIGKIGLNVSNGGRDLVVTKQLDKTTQRKISVTGLVGSTVIKRKDPDSGDVLVDIAQARVKETDAQGSTDTDAVLLLPLSKHFALGLSAADRTELYLASVHLEMHVGAIIEIPYYKSEEFFTFLEVVGVIVSVIISVASYGSLSWTSVIIGSAIGAAAAAAGDWYQKELQKQTEAANKQLVVDLKRVSDALARDMKGTKTDEMQDMLLNVTDVVGLVMQDLDSNISLEYDTLMELGLGNAQYNNDMLYKEKYQIYCDTESKIRFKEPNK